MRKYQFLFVFLLFLASSNAFAFMSFGGNQAGTGVYGASQGCPYRQSRAEAADEKSYLADKAVTDAEDQETNIIDRYSDTISFRDDTASALQTIIKNSHNEEDIVDCHVKIVETSKDDKDKKSTQKKAYSIAADGTSKEISYDGDVLTLANNLGKTDDGNADSFCRPIAGNKYEYDLTAVCNSDSIYNKPKSLSRAKSECKHMVDLLSSIDLRRRRAEDRAKKAEEDKDKAELAELDQQNRDQDYFDRTGRMPPQRTAYTEAGFCATCAAAEPMPKWPFFLAAGVDVLGMVNYRHNVNNALRYNSQMGLGTPIIGPGPGAPATSALLANMRLQGMGSGSFGCQPAMGYGNGPGGVYGNPYGNVSPYGMCGGVAYSPCAGGPGGQYPIGMPNPAMNGGIFPGGMGPGGMPGVYGGNGFFPNPYGVGQGPMFAGGPGFGPGFGGPGFGGPGFGGPMMGGFGGPGFGGGFPGGFGPGFGGGGPNGFYGMGYGNMFGGAGATFPGGFGPGGFRPGFGPGYGGGPGFGGPGFFGPGMGGFGGYGGPGGFMGGPGYGGFGGPGFGGGFPGGFGPGFGGGFGGPGGGYGGGYNPYSAYLQQGWYQVSLENADLQQKVYYLNSLQAQIFGPGPMMPGSFGGGPGYLGGPAGGWNFNLGITSPLGSSQGR